MLMINHDHCETFSTPRIHLIRSDHLKPFRGFVST